MSGASTSAMRISDHPRDLQGLAHQERGALIISTRTIEGRCIVLSRYANCRWHLVGQPTNRPPADQTLNFDVVSPVWRETMKAILYCYLCRGREGQKRPSPRAIVKLFRDVRPFLRHLDRLGITRLADVTPMVCAVYADACRSHRQPEPAGGRPLKASSLGHRFGAVEALHELSQRTDDAMALHPWPGTSATHLAGLTGRGSGYRGGQTPLMPDEVFTGLFQRAWSLIEDADALLNLRDELIVVRQAMGRDLRGIASSSEREVVRRGGWVGTSEYRAALLELRTACYVVVASLSGCRNHELAFIEAGACYSTDVSDGPDDEPEVCWWLRSYSTKTGEGRTQWMVPEAAVTALRVMERWAQPYQALIDTEIAQRRSVDPSDPEIAEAARHRRAVFLAATPQKRNQVRTMSGQMWNLALKAFAKKCGLSWDLASHQFRRKFANYAARSQFGDLRYLREHFKHWSMDMTLGYALNEAQETALYAEIQGELDDIKSSVVDTWLNPEVALAGGYGRNITAWRTQAITIFKDHRQMVRALADSTAIRSNGHAWCTADDSLCVGNDIERTRCSDCNNAVIGPQHAPLYKGLYDHLKEVRDCDDIGEGGLTVVQRDMDRCRRVLMTLEQEDPEGRAA